MTPCPAELHDGINSVVTPVTALCTEIRSGWCTGVGPSEFLSALAEYSRRAETRASRKPFSSPGVRFSSTDRVWSSVRTVSVMVGCEGEVKLGSEIRRGLENVGEAVRGGAQKGERYPHSISLMGCRVVMPGSEPVRREVPRHGPH